MDSVSRPLIAVLVATVAVFALWIVALKPSSSSHAGSANAGLGAYQSAINAARNSAAGQNRAAAAAGARVASTPANTTLPSTGHRHVAASPAPTASGSTPSVKAPTGVIATGQVATVDRALAAHKVLVLLFYNPAGIDDNAVKGQLASLPTDKGRVVKAAIPVGELGKYAAITTEVPVMVSPTLVVIDRQGQASTIVGYADEFEIAQRVQDAL